MMGRPKEPAPDSSSTWNRPSGRSTTTPSSSDHAWSPGWNVAPPKVTGGPAHPRGLVALAWVGAERLDADRHAGEGGDVARSTVDDDARASVVHAELGEDVAEHRLRTARPQSTTRTEPFTGCSSTDLTARCPRGSGPSSPGRRTFDARRYVARGGDQGASVTDAVGRLAPDGLLGIHLDWLPSYPLEVRAAVFGGGTHEGLSKRIGVAVVASRAERSRRRSMRWPTAPRMAAASSESSDT